MIYEKLSLLAGGALIALGITLGHAALTPPPPRITQKEIEAAVVRTLASKPVPSPAMRAYQAVRSSMVRVSAAGRTGTGVVVVDRGVILTSLHVVAGASHVLVTFPDGLESEATLASSQPENDLAVLQAHRVPDDLKAATLGRQAPFMGEHVTAAGFPFGIGPSVSHGIISGLGRESDWPDGKHRLRELIQFDAAANPGSSGGPLVNAAGEVVGIVTAILSPGEKTGFSGIAFAVPIENAAAAAGVPGQLGGTDEPRASPNGGRHLRGEEDESSTRTICRGSCCVILAQGHLLASKRCTGLAKTLTVKTLAAAVPRHRSRAPCRIPAPDPGLHRSLVGTRIYNQKTGEFATSLGPVFCNLLLADEINRPPAKVQSALLEVMQERQATMAGETLRLPEPFLVLATQNPIDPKALTRCPKRRSIASC